jgi:EpsI family protein
MTSTVRIALSATLLLGALVLVHFRSTGEAVPIRKSFQEFPQTIGVFKGQQTTTFDEEIINILKVNDYVARRYVDDRQRSLWLYIGYWQTQRKGAQIHSPKNCLPGSGWEPVEAKVIDVPVGPARPPIQVNRYLLQKEREKLLVLYWYQSQGRAVAGEIEARAQLVKNALLRNRTDGALVRVSAAVEGSVAETEAQLVAYVQAMYPIVADYLPD